MVMYTVIYGNVHLDKSKVTYVTMRMYNKLNEIKLCDQEVHSADERGKKPMQITRAQRSGKEPYHVAYDSVEITNKMQPCNRIYYSTVH